MDKTLSFKRDVYIDIADRFEKYITLGVIKQGERLPSVRNAATELRVNPNTVQRAYSVLEERGLIRSMPKKGAYVIYHDEVGRNERIEALSEELTRMKMTGFSKEEILIALEEVYKND